MAKKPASVKKPSIEDTALEFAKGEKEGLGIGSTKKVAQKGSQDSKSRSGKVPSGDIRLNANVRRELHTRIKIEAARQGRTIGDLIEELIDKYIP